MKATGWVCTPWHCLRSARRKGNTGQMSEYRTAELVAIEKLGEELGSDVNWITDNLAAASLAHAQTKGTLTAHGGKLDRILQNVERETGGDGDPLGDVLRRLLENGEAQIAALRRIEAAIAALRPAIA